MGALAFINAAKAKFRTAQRNKQAVEFKTAKDERLKLEKEMLLVRQLQGEKQTIQDLKQERFQTTMAGKIVKSIKTKIDKNRAEGNIIYKGMKLDNPFTKN